MTGNIMICREGVVKVLGFGIALLAGSQGGTDADQVRGTAGYLSPEQAQARVLDPRTDLYSLGCCLYQMVTGRLPFRGESPVAVAYQHIHDSPPDPGPLVPELPSALQQVIRRTLAKDPEQRHPSAGALADELRSLAQTLDDTPATTATPTTLALAGAEHTDGTTAGTLVAADYDDELDPAENPRGALLRRIGVLLVLVAVAAIVVALLAL
jgi:serine/threonine-protein kinase